MALDLADDRLIDPFGGSQDLQGHRLRQVSPAAFPEDPLRMLRGVQFAARFGLHVEPVTRQAMCAHAAAITTVAAERIAEELRKLFQAPAPSHGFYLMHEVGLLSHLFPELTRLTTYPDPHALVEANPFALEQTVFARTMRRLDVVQQHEELLYQGDLHLLLAALWSDSGWPEAATATPQQVATRSATIAQQRLEMLRMTMIGVQPAVVVTLIAASAFEISALASDAALRHLAHRLGCPDTPPMTCWPCATVCALRSTARYRCSSKIWRSMAMISKAWALRRDHISARFSPPCCTRCSMIRPGTPGSICSLSPRPSAARRRRDQRRSLPG
jgi:tRNA nucleotidyltransferase/poly(A) polymerase